MIADLNERYLVGVPGVCELWLIRHGDAYGGMGALAEGVIDPPLTERGRWEVERLAARMASVPIDAVWSSPLRRTAETAREIAAGRDLDVRIDDRLREVRMHWDEGREPERLAPGSYPFPEPEEEVAQRMRSVLADVVACLAGADGAAPPRAAVVTHNGTIAIYLMSVLGLRWGQLRVMPQFTSVSVVAVKDDLTVVHSIGDVTHLA